METSSLRSAAITTVAPLAWGTTYVVTGELLPPDRPLFAAVVRALPAGLLLLAWRRRLPRGAWWWRSLVLGLCNFALFFPLLFLGAYHLPGGLASTIGASAPLAVMALAWLLIHEPAGVVRVGAAGVGLVGVAVLVLRDPGGADLVGVAAALGSVLMSSLGFVLVKRWPAPVDNLTLVSWQLVAGGLLLVPVAAYVEGAPPAVDAGAVLGYAWIGTVGTVVAYLCWFHGLATMRAGAVSLIGLVNPVVATVLGVVVAGEAFGAVTATGMVLVLGGVLAGQPAVLEVVRRRLRRARPTATAELVAPTGEPGLARTAA